MLIVSISSIIFRDLFITDPEADKLSIESTKGGLFAKVYAKFDHSYYVTSTRRKLTLMEI